MLRWILLLAACSSRPDGSCGGGSQKGAPWPGWGGCADQQLRSSAHGPRSARPLWSHGGYGAASVAADGTIYFDGSALSPEGALRWHLSTTDGPPAIDAWGQLIFAADGLMALRPDGSEAWHEKLAGAARGALLGSDGTIYVDQYDSLSTFDAEGHPRWTLPVEWIDALAVARDGTAYLLRDHYPNSDLVAVSRDGEILWSTAITVFGAIAVADDGSAWIGGQHVLRDGTLAVALPTTWGTAIGADGTIYLATEGTLHAFAPDGRELWHDELSQLPDSTAPIVDADGQIYIANHARRPIDGPFVEMPVVVHAFAQNGTRLWSLDVGRGFAGPLSLGENRLYVPVQAMENNHLVALGP